MIKSLTDTVHYQGVALKEIDKSLREKFGFNELNPLLNTKLDISELPNILENINIEIEKRPTNEELNHILNLKVDKNEFEQYLNTKPSTNDLYNTRKKVEENQKNIESFMDNIHKILEGYNSLKNEIEKIKIDLNKKSNLEDVAEALELKADNDIINEINTIKKNIENDINLIREQIEEKNNKKNFSFIEEINEKIEEINKNKCDINDFKLMSDAFQDIKLNLSQRGDDIDNDLDRLIENIKAQFQTTNKLIEDIDNKKIEKKHLEDINNILIKKIDEDKFNISLGDLKNKLFESMNSFKEDYITNIKIFENKLESKTELFNNDYNNIIQELNKQNEIINNYIENEKNENNKKIESILNINNIEYNNFIQKIKEENKKLNMNLNEKLNKKLDEKKFDSYLNNIKKELDSKLSILNFQKNKESLQISLNQQLQTKINIKDLDNILQTKADISLVNDKISSIDFNVLKDYINTVDYELKQKMESMYNDYLNILNQNLENFNASIASKAKTDFDSIYKILNKKVNIDDLKNSLNELNQELDNKVNINIFEQAMNNQSLINDIICNENQVGRWLWKSGKIKGGYTIPWETQSVNTAPDNYIWEKDKSVINVVKGGIYQISMGFYSSKKPQLQILINTDIVINLNNANYWNKNSNGSNNNKNIKKMMGLSFNEFFILQDNSKIAVTFNGEDGFGFLGLKKL